MSPRQQAIKDIKSELKDEHKAFIAFRTELNPVINMLVKKQIEEQGSIFAPISRDRCQIVAHCEYHQGNTQYSNYEEYYGK